jgi:asparagine synthase (glutamine-hydrolysing)
MCGIAGVFAPGMGFSNNGVGDILSRMAEAMSHRGPDAEGVWVEDESGLGFCHRRLSIVDLSETGSQPMHSHGSRLVICFNGEIYNHKALRRDLENRERVEWRGTSDTEVFLEYISRFGLHRALEAASGSFAFALYDRRDRVLHLARDKFGEKPLYYFNSTGRFGFASDLRCIKKSGLIDCEIDQSVLAEYMAFGYIHAPKSIYRHVRKVLPGTLLTFRFADGLVEDPDENTYFSAGKSCGKEINSPDEALARLDAAMSSAVSVQGESDVPMGCYLSGGVDSSLVAYYMQSQSTVPVKTFTAKFEIPAFDESTHASKVSEFLGTDHQTIVITESEMIAALMAGRQIYDEPFSDSSALRVLAQHTASQVTCVLSGDGADEMFGGYSGYWQLRGLYEHLNRYKGILKPLINASTLVPSWLMDRVLLWLRSAATGTSFSLPPSARVAALARSFVATDEAEFFVEMKKLTWPGEELLSQHLRSSQSKISVRNKLDGAHEFLEQIAAYEQQDYLPNDILVKSDRTSMAFGLESRAPFLDPGVAGLARSIGAGIKSADGVPKWPLKELLYQKVPRALVERPKMGFNLPIADWLRNEMREWCAEVLFEESRGGDGYFDHKAVERILHLHQSRKFDLSPIIWRLISFAEWKARTAHEN